MTYPLIIFCVVVAMYIRTLTYGYAIDDLYVAKRSVGKESPKKFWTRAYLSWQGVCYKNPVLAHSITFILHLTNSLLVYYVFGRNQVSFLTALLWCIHPAGSQGSVWLSGKGYSTAALFSFLMFGMKWVSPVFYLMAFAYGGFSATFAPAIFLTTPYWYIAGLIPLGFLINWKRIKTAIGYKWSITPALTKKISARRVILYFKTLGYYSWLTLFPIRLGVYHDYLYTYGLTSEDTKKWHKPDLYALFGAIVIGGTAYLFAVNRTGAITTGLFWYVLLISQWCNFPVTLQQAIGERYLYLPLVGAIYALINAIGLIPDPVMRAALISGFGMMYAVRMTLHVPSYRNIHFQIDHNLTNFPECYALWTWKGQEEKNRGAFFTAIEAWFQGWKLRKIDFRLNNNIAVLLTEVGQLDLALDFLKLAQENIPGDQMAAGMEYINTARSRIMEIKRAQKSAIQQPISKGGIILPRGQV